MEFKEDKKRYNSCIFSDLTTDKDLKTVFQLPVSFPGSARMNGTTPILVTLDQMWWKTTSLSSTASGLESVP